MPAKSADFIPYLLDGQHAIRNDLGTDIMHSQKDLYNINLTTLALISMVMKVIQDVAPQVTDQVWADRLAGSIDMTGGWPAWILSQIAREDLALYGASVTDSLETILAKKAAYYGS